MQSSHGDEELRESISKLLFASFGGLAPQVYEIKKGNFLTKFGVLFVGKYENSLRGLKCRSWQTLSELYE